MKAFRRARERSEAQPRDGRDGPSVAMLTVRVAMAASAIVGVAYALIAVVVVIFVTNNLTAGIDDRLNRALAPVPNQAGPDQPFGQQGAPDRPFGPPVLLWRISPTGSITSLNTSNIDLPAAYRHVVGPATVSVGGVDIRIEGASRGLDYVVVGLTTEDVSQTESTLIVAEFGIGCALLLVVFLGAVAIGRRVASPIEPRAGASSSSRPMRRTSCAPRSRSSRPRRRWPWRAAGTRRGIRLPSVASMAS